jgi:hypothetical protein
MDVRRTVMKKLAIIIASLATLSGCATYYPAPGYATRGYGQPDANGWQVVSVTPVAPGTAAANGGNAVVSSAPAYADPVYAPAPVYGAPVYAAPVYAAPVYDPFWYPPVSIGLGFSFGSWCCHGGHGGGHWGGYHGGHGHR